MVKYAVDCRTYRIPSYTKKGKLRGYKRLYPAFKDIVKMRGLDIRECCPYRPGETRNLELIRLTKDELEQLFPDEFWQGGSDEP